MNFICYWLRDNYIKKKYIYFARSCHCHSWFSFTFRFYFFFHGSSHTNFGYRFRAMNNHVLIWKKSNSIGAGWNKKTLRFHEHLWHKIDDNQKVIFAINLFVFLHICVVKYSSNGDIMYINIFFSFIPGQSPQMKSKKLCSKSHKVNFPNDLPIIH